MEGKRLISAEERFNSNFFSLLSWFEERCPENYVSIFINIKAAAEFLGDETVVMQFISNINNLLPVIESKNIDSMRQFLNASLKNYNLKKASYKDTIDNLTTFSKQEELEFWDFMESLVRCAINFSYDNNRTSMGKFDVLELSKKWDVLLGEKIYDDYVESSSSED